MALTMGRPAAPEKSDAGNSFNRRQQDSVLFGNSLKKEIPDFPAANSVFWLKGKNRQGQEKNIPITNSILSKHMMLLGGIGTGKTNAFFQMLSQICLTGDDVMIIFDTKGDFYQEFYRAGDVVISNDATAVGIDGKSDYWNIFQEIASGEQEYAMRCCHGKILSKQ